MAPDDVRTWRNVLIVTGGMVPQVVTETVWALAKRQREPFVPDKIVCAVTRKIADRFGDELQDALDRLAVAWDFAPRWGGPEYRYPYYDKDDEDADRRGRPVQDIRSDLDSVRFGDLVAEIVRKETLDPEARVHLSLAGGRKSMSFHGGAALGLFARPQDELSHVLVHPADFEQCPDFWFPTRDDVYVEHRITKARLNAKDADVKLALVPFVRLRDRLPETILIQPMNYAGHVAEANANLGRVPMTLELVTAERLVVIGDLLTIHDLSNRDFALYQLMSEWKRNEIPGAGPDGVGPDHKGWLTEHMFRYPEDAECNPVSRYLEIYEETFKTGTDRAEDARYSVTPEPTSDRHREDNAVYFRTVKSRLMKAIRSHFTTSDLADRFGAPARAIRGRGREARFGLKLLPQEIEIRAG